MLFDFPYSLCVFYICVQIRIKSDEKLLLPEASISLKLYNISERNIWYAVCIIRYDLVILRQGTSNAKFKSHLVIEVQWIRNFLWDLPHKTKSYYARMFEWNLMWSFFQWKFDTINEMAAIWAKGFAYEQAFEFIWCYLFSCVECNFPYFHCFRIQNYLKYSNSYSYTVVVDLDLGGHNWNSINILIYASRDICKIS